MAPDTDTLQAPAFLIAMPQVLDPFFHRSVVLLVHHDGEGSVGFIINRPTAIHLPDILLGMELEWGGDRGAVAYFGGPVQPQLGSVLFTPPTAGLPQDYEGCSEICPEVVVTQHVGDLALLAGTPPENFRLLLGYAGWGAGQLIEEILRNDWLTAPVAQQLVFEAEADEVWSEALHSVGVDPDSLPSWSPAAGDEGAN